MMAQKHLKELLSEDQEPFHLHSYIADRRSQLNKRPNKIQKLQQIKKHNTKPISNLKKQTCFFSFQNSPDVKKSPFLDFPSPLKSPCKSPSGNGKVFLHIPARTAALLLEAAVRIQKQSSSAKPKSTQNVKSVGLGLFGSILKRLKDKNRTQKREIGSGSVKDEKLEVVVEKSAYENGVSSCSCNWSETNEEKSLDLETSSSFSSEEELEERVNGAFCESPFRFSLQKSPSSSGNRTPDFLSPATSPSRLNKKEPKNHTAEEALQKSQQEDEEEKEQCSPVSVLDPPFDDEDENEGGDEEDGYGLECSYAIVQRFKQQLLNKLHRFERLAELDPIELEKRMLEDLDDDDENLMEEEQRDYDDDESLSYSEENVDEFVREVFNKSSFSQPRKIPSDMKMLLSDLVAEESQSGSGDREAVVKRVCKRLDSGVEVESNTIDMMVELDFRREMDAWRRYYDQEQMRGMAMEVELAIFGSLVEELVC